ncbi:glycoside hydrolase family 2 protein [Streptosporangium sp. G11]|uniref:glycoside hydrolase family 2 protein n=1 Tax=Streptosporangium sp. G11 TaxID=3436926 RepID=UPI003EB75471
MYRPLVDGWTLSGADHHEISAAVPGCVHTDLLAAGAIADPYLDANEAEVGWIGRTEWTYRTTFDWEPDGHERVDLVCDGLDTVATVLLNGVEIGTTANMHRSYRFSVRDVLQAGSNELTVRFAAPYAYAEEQSAAHGPRPGPYDEPFMFIRKMACNFGWDWGPTLVTSGIWRSIGLHSWSGARLAEVRPLVRADGVDVHVTVERSGHTAQARHGREVTVDAEVAGISRKVRLAPGDDTVVIRLDVTDVESWWPRGYGEQPLYPLTVRTDAEEWTREIGFRTVELEPEAFRIVINGRPVFMKGFNWIPDDCFPTRVTPQRLAERFDQVIGAGANTLRVWGGGLYESDAFYTLADRLGLMVWQDFTFACAAYPEEEPFRTEVEAEARDNVARLSSHPSLVLWCGNNENLWGDQHWGWREKLRGRSWGAGFYHDLLPGIVAELDPTRPYWPGTPYSGAPELDVEDPSRGTIHIWDVWNREDYTTYTAYRPRFVAEFGFQGPPTYATLRRGSTQTPPVSHQKAIDGEGKLLRGLGEHLPQPETFDDWHYYTQLNQARALAFGVERYRALMPYCMGAIVWQLNDCWPVTSWAAVDGEGRLKPLWYGLRRSFADQLVTFQEDAVALVNDTDHQWAGELAVTRHDLTGAPLAKEYFSVCVPARSVERVSLPRTLSSVTNPAEELLVATVGDARAVRFFAEDPAVAYPAAAFEARVERAEDELRVHVTATTVLRELAIFPDRLDPDAVIDDQLVTLLPGESVTFRIRSRQELDAAALTRFPVLRCVNEAR